MANEKNRDVREYNLPSTEEMMGCIEDMFAFGPRRIGTPPDLKCEDYLADALRASGFENVRKDPIPVRVWEAKDYKLSVRSASEKEFEAVPAFYIPYTAFTPAEGVDGELLYVEPFDAADHLLKNWKGKVVVANIRFPKLDTDELSRFSMGLHDPQGAVKGISRFAVWVRMYWSLYREAAKRGAAGFIGILADHYTGGQNYYAPYGFKEKDIHDKPIPGFWVDRVTGAEIRKLAKKGSSRAKLLLTGSLNDGVSHNVIGEIPGESREAYIIACHHDSPFSSAVEDASGCSVVLAAAKHFARTRELKRTLIVMFTAGHFYGSIGTRTFIERNPDGILDRTALEFHVEHIAREAVEKADGGIEVLDRPDFVGAFVPFNRKIKRAVLNAVVSEGLDGTMLLPAHGPLGDFPPTDGGDFHIAGVPLVNFISPPVYLLNEEDTLDKVAKDRLVPTARTVVSVLRQIDGAPLHKLRRVDYTVKANAMHLLRRVIKLRALAMGV
ncbi:MAG TPA: M28 family peptidase [bacterium]|nr:M28 family peptidase [bacterium]